MNRKMIAALMAIVMLLTLAACKKNTETEVETTFAAETDPAVIETTVDPIDVEGIPRETEAAVNKATVIEKSESAEEEETKAADAEDEDTDAVQKAEEPVETMAPEVEVHIKGETEYEKLLEMSGSEQKEFMESFESEDAFFEWLEKSKEEYETENPAIEIGGDGTVDLSK